MRNFLCVGIIVKPQGVKGQVKVEPLTDDIARFGWLEKIYLKNDERYREIKVLLSRHDERFVFLNLEGVEDMNAAESLRGQELYVDRESAINLPEGRWFVADLIGCKVLDDSGNLLGTLTDVLQAGGNDVFEVKGKSTFMFPAIKELLLAVDIPGERIVVDAKRLDEVAVYED